MSEAKQRLLEIMKQTGSSGLAEHESNNENEYMKNFLFIPAHQRLLEPSILLILGGRGAGKSALFRMLSIETGRKALISGASQLHDPEQELWLSGFGRVKNTKYNLPAPESIERALTGADNYKIRSFWLGLWIGMLFHDPSSEDIRRFFTKIPQDLITKLSESLPMVSAWLPMVEDNFDNINSIFDQIDQYLSDYNRWLYITYDELDRLTTTHATLAAPIRELLAFWLDRYRRWERIRPKIFLRTDLFREEFLGFPDASKLRPHQLQLEWTTSWLYQLLIKRLSNADEEMLNYINRINGLIIRQDGRFGFIPSQDERLHQQFMELLVGKFMGANARKGDSHRWVPNHLQDAGGRIAPRSFLKLFSRAAEIELNRFDEKQLLEDRLLQPSALQGSLMETSTDRIRELANEEYPWLEQLKLNLIGVTVPTNKEVFIDAIKRTQWTANLIPPVQQPIELIEYMKSLGILEQRSDGRVNMPEIYLYGFQMKRMGGVKRPS